MIGPVAAVASVFSTDDGASLNFDELMLAVQQADVIVIGETHTDANGHRWQQEFLHELVTQDVSFSLSLEEFDRGQQSALDEYSAGKIDGEGLKSVRAFVGPSIRENWLEWYLPKLQIVRDAEVDMIASNAPLKYSRMARNKGCENLGELPVAEQALFDCPLLPVDPEYQARFFKTMSRISRKNQSMGMKPLDEPQMAKMFRAHRVWDATMAQSIAALYQSDGRPVVHVVGSFHTDFNGGLLQELQARDSELRVLVITIRSRSATELLSTDKDRSDIVVYSGD